MSSRITATLSHVADRKREVAELRLNFDGEEKDVTVAVNGSSLTRISRRTPDLAHDFLTIASCVYAADESVIRSVEEDRWTRDIALRIPVRNLENWLPVATQLSECVSFLTGDRWHITFEESQNKLIRRRVRRRVTRILPLRGDAVSLFSGGLDSLIGAIDWLTDNPDSPLLLVGHYDRGVAGPGKDQKRLAERCGAHFGSRFRLVQTQVGAVGDRGETSFRSRSLLFLALAAYSAELLGRGTPILIPENGPIALNYPLTPARRGSCSTRTVHPYFISAINAVLKTAGMDHPILNPYSLMTKGEMVSECRDQEFLDATYEISRSCAKSNRRTWWENRKALGCGVCVPCLFRRASLFKSGRDTEVYGIPLENLDSREVLPDDVVALAAFVRRADNDRAIISGLLANGKLPIDDINAYVDMVKRMRSEVRAFLVGVGNPFIKAFIGKK